MEKLMLPASGQDTDTAVAPDLNPWPLTVATYNIHGAIGTDGRLAPQRIADVLREIDADVIALQEVPLGGAGRASVLDLLEEATGFHAVEGPTEDRPERRYGNAVLSRYPIIAKRTIDLSFGSREPRGALDADIDCHGHPLRVIATHLGLQPAERRHQIRLLLQAFDTDRMPVILTGDLNEWFVWGRPLRWLVSHFEPVPAPRTFPSRFPVFALDRLWISPRHRLVRVEVHATPLARLASDHLPLIAHIAG
ncbi:endonuclease/exonuclease/phosphatase family protein [Noviherbaspirillum suwonense]|jgi:endonuclease/exonuclease/phosphatase family metal-dependent hydrolase|uniref:Metal-dependent hydrolase, endonuclease/exonuclease/phosphatase family n=1 Tax=Noviherbaspirillum suwonense TaxID=1224511 RepID=A0ABY1QII0_9BURK|nr:endonuclease/exonuclease/phosphatase family protein [Noviherbaspirillum suwonense]SMP70111.1 Metal-dependent hydrolase, endonuclease/exonuclease/phosphatase family [Noviherbaspirillum suwonense]